LEDPQIVALGAATHIQSISNLASQWEATAGTAAAALRRPPFECQRRQLLSARL
jgi:hypothetical protein